MSLKGETQREDAYPKCNGQWSKYSTKHLQECNHHRPCVDRCFQVFLKTLAHFKKQRTKEIKGWEKKGKSKDLELHKKADRDLMSILRCTQYQQDHISISEKRESKTKKATLLHYKPQ